MKQQVYTILLNILKQCSRLYLWRTHPYIIGITGSVGKTSCRQVVSGVLEQIQGSEKKVKIYTSPKNYNSELGLIFSIFQIEEYTPSVKNLLIILLKIIKKSIFSKKGYDILVAEYGIDSPGDMDFLLSVMKPDIGILTKLDSVHADNFRGGTDELWQDKCKLLLASREKTFFNVHDDFPKKYESMFREPTKLFSKKLNIDIGYSSHQLLQYFEYKKKKISINLPGEENVEYTLLALQIAEYLSYNQVKKSFSFKKCKPFASLSLTEETYNFRFELQAGRFSLFHKNNNILIDSTYNGGPRSMERSIQTTKDIQKFISPEAKLIFVLGDMREIGDEQISEHKKLAHKIIGSAAVFSIGPVMYQYMIPELKSLGYTGEIVSSLSSREIGNKLKEYLENHTEEQHIILFKGSQNTIYVEEALSELLTPSEQKNLPRQSEDWKKKKEEFFSGL